MVRRGQLAVVQHAVFVLVGEVIAVRVKEAVAIPERAVREKLQPRLVLHTVGAEPISADREEEDVAYPSSQLLVRFLPSSDGLISGANKVIEKNDGIVRSKAGPEEIASANEEGIKLLVVQIVCESKLVEHVVATLARA